MQDKAFFTKTLDLLSRRHVYAHTLWSYGLKHDDPAAIREFLQNCGDFLAACGAYLESPLVTIDPVVRKTYEHLEYSPLVNARAHRLGKKREIVNERILQQYQRLMGILRYKKTLGDDDLMAVTYYMLLQDRIEEALCRVLPPEDWGQATHLFIFHGRRTCAAKQPRCPQCTLRSLCPWPGKR
jgi:hypothetical protein